MPWRIVIDFSDQGHLPTVSHQIRGFRDDLYKSCLADGWSSLSRHTHDTAPDRLVVAVKSSGRVRRTSAMVNRLLEDHFLTSYAQVSEINDTPG